MPVNPGPRLTQVWTVSAGWLRGRAPWASRFARERGAKKARQDTCEAVERLGGVSCRGAEVLTQERTPTSSPRRGPVQLSARWRPGGMYARLRGHDARGHRLTRN
jgi:hypothetical protein